MKEIENYLTANSEFEEAKASLARLARLLEDVGKRLQSFPEYTHFSNVGEGGGLPMDIVMSSRSRSYDANEWPTPLDLQKAIGRRFEAKRRAQEAWGAVPANLQASLVAPKL